MTLNQVCRLTTLGLDVLAELTAKLSAYDVCKLRFTGNKLLWHLLKEGGVRKLTFDLVSAFPLASWPAFIHEFNRLEVFRIYTDSKITLEDIYDDYAIKPVFTNLPETVEYLVLEHLRSTRVFMTEPNCRLFPRLMGLVLSGSRAIDHSDLACVPTTLYELSISLLGGVFLSYIPAPLLFKLHVKLLTHTIKRGQLDTHTFSQLRDLRLFVSCVDAQWGTFPSSLTRLSTNIAIRSNSDVCKLPEKLMWLECAIHPGACQTDLLKELPKSLTYLQFTSLPTNDYKQEDYRLLFKMGSMDDVVAAALPRNLRTLVLPRCVPVKTTAVSFLPPLTELSCVIMDPEVTKKVPDWKYFRPTCLPPNLKVFRNVDSTTYLDCLWNNLPTKLIALCGASLTSAVHIAWPPNLQFLETAVAIQNWGKYNLLEEPPENDSKAESSQDSLTVGNSKTAVPGTGCIFPNSLTTLYITLKSPAPLLSIVPQSKNLQKLGIVVRFSDVRLIFKSGWSRWLPPSLEELSVSCPHSLCDDMWFECLKLPNLRILRLDLPWDLNIPLSSASFSYLPKTLETISMTAPNGFEVINWQPFTKLRHMRLRGYSTLLFDVDPSYYPPNLAALKIFTFESNPFVPEKFAERFTKSHIRIEIVTAEESENYSRDSPFVGRQDDQPDRFFDTSLLGF